MTPQEAYYYLRLAIPLRPELRFRSWPNVPNPLPKLSPYEGACYIGTEVFCHLVEGGATPYCNENRSHFWAQIGEVKWDVTWDQFENGFDYSTGRKTRFKNLSKRAKLLLNEVAVLVENQT